MKARLFARFGPEKGLDVEFGSEATVGRGKENTVLLSSREVSQLHARVFFDVESAAYWVEDLGSLNGTRLDGEAVNGRERLGELHVLSFGDLAELFFVELDREPAPAAEAEAVPVETTGGKTRIDAEVPTLPLALSQPPNDGGTRVDSEAPTLPIRLRDKKGHSPTDGKSGTATRVEETPAELPTSLGSNDVAEGPAAAAEFVLEVPGEGGGRFELQQGDNLVGRSGRAQVALQNRELSRRHAILRVEGDRVWLRDEGSRNHTFVGGEEIAEEVEIEPGSEIRFGRLEVRLIHGAADAGREESE